jgi:hypothetical protein
MVLVNGQISALANPSKGNASYILNFTGPMLQCKETDHKYMTDFVPSEWVYQVGNDYFRNDSIENIPDTVFEQDAEGQIVLYDSPSREGLQVTPCPRKNRNGAYVMEEPSYLIRPYTQTNCTAAAADYTVNVTFVNGNQHIDYTVGESRALKTNVPWGDLPRDWDFSPLQSAGEHANIVALIDSFLLNFLMLQGTSERYFQFNETSATNAETVKLSNGSTVDVCTPGSFDPQWIGNDSSK